MENANLFRESGPDKSKRMVDPLLRQRSGPNPSAGAAGSKKGGQLAVIGGRVASGAKVRTTRGRLSALRVFH
jgi:hypothetical protein